MMNLYSVAMCRKKNQKDVKRTKEESTARSILRKNKNTLLKEALTGNTTVSLQSERYLGYLDIVVDNELGRFYVSTMEDNEIRIEILNKPWWKCLLDFFKYYKPKELTKEEIEQEEIEDYNEVLDRF
jgi:hypothetical protein